MFAPAPTVVDLIAPYSEAMHNADTAYQRALVRCYGVKQAGTERYRQSHTDERVQAAKSAYLQASTVWNRELKAARQKVAEYRQGVLQSFRVTANDLRSRIQIQDRYLEPVMVIIPKEPDLQEIHLSGAEMEAYWQDVTAIRAFDWTISMQDARIIACKDRIEKAWDVMVFS